MKLHLAPLFALACLLPVAPLHAATESGTECARHVISNKDTLNGKTVRLDVIALTRPRTGVINEKQDKVTVFLAHTWDEKNKQPGGTILVAFDRANEKKAERDFGTALDRGQKGDRKPETRELKGKLVKLDNGACLIDVNGKAAEALADLKKELREAEDGPDGKPGVRRPRS